MLGLSLLFLLGAASLHALSNVLIKQARDKLAFAWWTMAALTSLGSPLLFFVGQPPPIGWEYVVASGLIEAIYFITLTRAYALGDLSQVYPIARGAAPLFTLLWATLFLGEQPSLGGFIGIGLIVSGLYLINLPSLAEWRRPLAGLGSSPTRWALLTGFLISIYSAIDKVGVRYFDPLVYLYLFLTVTCLALGVQWFIPARRAVLIGEVRPAEIARTLSAKARPVMRVLAGSLLGTAAYTLVLMALQLSPVSYVSPVRELSVVIGAWIGTRFMGEPGGRVRIGASLLIAGGIVTITVFG
jgi:uncharacterized membrane protein